MKRAALALMLSALTLLPSCGDEETPLAPYREDILDVYTDADGFASQLLRDDGTRLTVANRVGGLPADTSYRVMALYTEEGGNAHLTSLAQVLAPLPAAYLHGASMADPVDVEAVWSGGGYINLRLALKTGGLPHTFGFDDRYASGGANFQKTSPPFTTCCAKDARRHAPWLPARWTTCAGPCASTTLKTRRSSRSSRSSLPKTHKQACYRRD